MGVELLIKDLLKMESSQEMTGIMQKEKGFTFVVKRAKSPAWFHTQVFVLDIFGIDGNPVAGHTGDSVESIVEYLQSISYGSFAPYRGFGINYVVTPLCIHCALSRNATVLRMDLTCGEKKDSISLLHEIQSSIDAHHKELCIKTTPEDLNGGKSTVKYEVKSVKARALTFPGLQIGSHFAIKPVKEYIRPADGCMQVWRKFSDCANGPNAIAIEGSRTTQIFPNTEVYVVETSGVVKVSIIT